MEGLTELIVTKDIPERRTKMIELGDAFIAFPGGTGTLEEVSEVMSKLALKQIDAPCVLYNLNGYYEGLKALLKHMVEMGLSTEEKQEKVYFAENLGDIKAILGAENNIKSGIAHFSRNPAFCSYAILRSAVRALFPHAPGRAPARCTARSMRRAWPSIRHESLLP